MATLQAPFPYFGGKSRVKAEVWARLGDVANYVEPFFGSGAVLLGRPHKPKIETVNDKDGFVANFWRALQHDPDAVAIHVDNPVNECDLHARELWLLGQRESITERLMGDPYFYDAQVAGWWAWGLSCWIGGGWTSGEGPWVAEDGKMVKKMGEEDGVERKRPHLSTLGQGISRQRPHLGNAGRSINRLGLCEQRLAWLKEWLNSLAARLHRVRVCCGDWSRVCGPSVTFGHGLTGVFLDPPYPASAGRSEELYAVDDLGVAHVAQQWALEQGSNPRMRIVFAGYEGSLDFPSDWSIYAWKASGGYANQGHGQGTINATRERLWFSPHCLKAEQLSLWNTEAMEIQGMKPSGHSS